MAEKPIERPANQPPNLEPARKRTHPDMDFQAAIKKAKRDYQKGNDRPPPNATVLSKALPPTRIPGLGNLTSENHTRKPEDAQITREEELGGVKQEKRDKLESRDVSGKQTTTDTYAGLTGGLSRGSSSVVVSLPEYGFQVLLLSTHGAKQDAQKVSSRPFAPPKKPSRKGRRPVDDKIETIETRTTTNPASFYDNVDMKAKFVRGDLVTVSNINTLIKNCQTAAARHVDLNIANLRKRLHQMEFYDFLTPIIVKKSKVLDDDTGLPQIFDDPDKVGFPWDIKADALTLYLRWLKGVLDPHLLRGIDTERKGAGTKHTGHKLRKDYLGTVSCNVWGDNNLQNGQWWPLQICAKRDGGHGEIEGGIHGQSGKGAFSVVLSNGGYDDLDDGDRILYCGTSGLKDQPSAGTSRLLETYQSSSSHPVRVIRTAKLPKDNRYRPVKGLRYDGLYDVVSYEILHAETAMHRFELRRRPGQDPIRYMGVEARPTDEEIAEFAKIRQLLNLT